MKLHLPKPLRNSVLACIAAVAGIATPTLGTATFAGGVVAFTLASQQAMADYVWKEENLGNKTADDWKTSSNWETENQEAVTIPNGSNGPLTVGGNMWEKVCLAGNGTAGALVFGSEESRIAFDGWDTNFDLSNGVTLYGSFTKFQSNSAMTINIDNNSQFNALLSGNGNCGNVLNVNVGGGSLFALTLNKGRGGDGINLNLNAADAAATIVGNNHEITNHLSVTTSILEGVADNTWGSKNLGLTITGVTNIDSVLAFNFGEGWELTTTEITESNYTALGGKCYVFNQDGVYKVLYSSAAPVTAVCEWRGADLSWGVGTEFADAVAYVQGADVIFSTGNASATLTENIIADVVTINENVNVQISGGFSLEASSYEIGANASLELATTGNSVSTVSVATGGKLVLANSGNSLGTVSVADGGELVLSPGKEVTLSEILPGAQLHVNGIVRITGDQTKVTSLGSELNNIRVVVDGAALNSGEAYFAKDVTLQNNAVLTYTGQSSEMFNWGVNQKISVLSGSRMELGGRRISLEADGNGADTLVLSDGIINGTGDGNSLVDICKSAITVTSSGTSAITGPVRITNSSTIGFNVKNGSLSLGEVKERGAASIVKTGAGTLVLTETAQHTGTTTVQSGKLKLENGVNLSSGIVLDGGSLVVAGTSTGTSVTGLGSVLVEKAASLTLTNASGLFSKKGQGTLTIGTLTGSALGMNYEGALTINNLNLDENAVLSYGNVENGNLIKIDALSGKVLLDVVAVQNQLATGVNLGIASSIAKEQISVLGLAANEYTLTNNDGYWKLSSDTKLHSEWDLNWGTTIVSSAPTNLSAQAIAVDQMNSAGEGLGEGAYLVDGRVAIKLGENGATADNFKGSCDDPVGIAGGAFAQKGTHGKTVEIPNGVWIQAEDGMYGIIAGGSIAVNYNNNNRSSAVVRTDSHIIIDDKSTDDSALAVLNVVGANYGDCVDKADDKTHKFYGDTYISVKSDSVWTDVIGGSVTYHGGRTIMEGDTHIFVYTPLTSHTDTKHRNEVYAVIGGMEAADNNASAHELTGNTNVTIDLSGSDATTAFAKKIIGGNVVHGTSTLTGTSKVSINGVNKEGTAITFSDVVVGGSYIRTNDGTSSVGNSVLSITGGSFSTYVVGGDYTTAASTSTIGSTSVTISGGTYAASSYACDANGRALTGVIVGGSVLTGNTAGTSMNVDSASVTITGGTVASDIYGGNVDAFSQSSGNAITSHVEKATVTLNGKDATVTNVYGGSFTMRDNSSATLTQGSILVDLVAGNVAGNVYAAGRQLHRTTIDTQSTEVRLSKDVVFTSEAALVSGGYDFGCTTPSHYASAVKSTVGSSTLVLTGSQNRTAVSFVDFDTIKVTDTTDAAAASANATIASLTTSTAVTKTGAGTLTLAGGTYALTNGLTVAEGTLATSGATALGGALTLANGVGLNVSAGTLAIGGALTLGSGMTLTMGAIHLGDNVIMTGVNSVTGLTGEVAASSIFSSITGIANIEDYKVKYVDNSLVLVNASAKELTWDVQYSTWANGQAFATVDGEAVNFKNNDIAIFGTLTENEAVTIHSDGVTATSVTIAAGADKSYSFSGGQLTTGSLTVSSGTAVFGNNTLQLAGLSAATVANGGVLDVSAYGLGAFSQLVTKTTGDGTVKIGGYANDAGHSGAEVDLTAIEGTTLNLNANYVVSGNMALDGGNTAETVAVKKGLTVGTLRVQNGTILELVGGELNGLIQLGLGRNQTGGAPASEAGHLVIHSGATVAASDIMKVTAQNAGACTITMDGGILKLTTSETITDIATTITGGTLVADEASWGITGATIGGATVTTSGDYTITLRDTTLTDKLTVSAGKLALTGSVDINPTGGFDAKVDGDPRYYAVGSEQPTANGFRFLTKVYTLADGDGALDVTGVTSWKMDGTTLGTEDYTYADKQLTVNTADGTLYWVNSGTVNYGASGTEGSEGYVPATVMTGATGLALNGGILQLNTTLTGLNIERKGTTGTASDGTINLNGTGVTLTAAQVTGTGSATLTGTGVYDLGTVTNLGTAITVPNALKVSFGDTWTGTVRLTGSVANIALSDLGNDSSTIQLAGVSGYLKTEQNKTYSSNLLLSDGGFTFTEKNGYTYTLSGAITGAGNFSVVSSGDGPMVLNLTGNLSAWEGGFVVAQHATSTNTQNITLNLTGGGNLFTSSGKGIEMNRGGKMDVTIGNADKATTMNAAIANIGTGTLNLTTVGTTTLKKNVAVSSLSNSGTLTVNGTLAAGAAVTNNGTLELTQAAATLASLANAGTLEVKNATMVSGEGADAITTYKDLTVTGGISGVTTGEVTTLGSIKGGNLILQGASNELAKLELVGSLTLGVAAVKNADGVITTAGVASTLVTTGQLSVTGDVNVLTLGAGITETSNGVTTSYGMLKAAGLAGTLNFVIAEDELTRYMGTSNTLTLATITGLTTTDVSLNKVAGNTQWSDTDHAWTDSEGQYTYKLSVDTTNGTLTLTRENLGIIWNGAPDEKWVMDVENDGVADTMSWTDKSGTTDLAYTGAESVIFDGRGFTGVIISGDVETKNVNINAEDKTYTFTGDATTKLVIQVPADPEDPETLIDKEYDIIDTLTIQNKLSVLKGTLKADAGLDVYAVHSVEVLNGAALELLSGASVHALAGISNAGTVTIGASSETQGAAALYVEGEGSVNNSGTMVVNGTLLAGYGMGVAANGSNINNSGTLTNAGMIKADGNLDNSGTYTQTAGSLTVYGNVLNTGSVTETTPAGGMNITDGYAVVGGNLTNDGDMSISGGAQTRVDDLYEEDCDNLEVGGNLVNTGTFTVSGEGTKVTVGDVDNDGTLSVAGGSMTVTGNLDNTDGDIIIGTAAVADNPETDENETQAATNGTLSVKGNLTHAGNGDIVVNSGSSLDVAGDLAADGMTLDFDGSVTVGGTAELKDLTIAEGATFTAENATITGVLDNDGSLTVTTTEVKDENGNPVLDKDNNKTYTGGQLSIGTLTGAGVVHVEEGGTLSIGSSVNFTGTLTGEGKLTTGNQAFTLLTKQDEVTDVALATDISAKSLVVAGQWMNDAGEVVAEGTPGAKWASANGSILGEVATDSITFTKLDTTGNKHLTMESLQAYSTSTASGVTQVEVALSQLDTEEGVAELIKTGVHTYNLLSYVGGTVNLTLADMAYDREQQLWKSGLKLGELTSATTMALRAAGTNVSISVLNQSLADATWNTAGETTGIGLDLGTLTNGTMVLKGNDMLDKVQSVNVTKDVTLDLSSTDTNAVKVNGLTGGKTLNIAGNGDVVNVSTVAGGFDGTLGLDNVQATVSGKLDTVKLTNKTVADLAVTNTNVEALTSGLTLNGSMKGGKLSISKAAGVKGTLKIDGTDLIIAYDDKGALSMSTANVATTGQVLVNMDKTTGEAGDIFIGKDGVASKLMEKYYANVRFEDNKGVVADRNTVYYTSKLADSSSTDNGKAGLAMADEALLNANPQGDTVTGDLAAVLDELDTMVATGNKAGADKLGASLAGASTAVLGMAAMGDVDRQLRAIRNRTTTMGVDQSVVNADMPYFNAWINAEGDSREMGEDGTLGGYKLNSYGGTVGFDVDIEPTLTAGMALTAMYGDLDATGTDQATGNLDSYYVSAFARYCGSAWTHTFVGTIGMGDISLDRTVGSAQVKGETDSMSFGLMYEVGRVYAMDEDGTTCLQPVFNVTWKHTTVDAYTEKGGDVALSVDEQSLDTITFGLGARLQTVVGESMYNRTSIFECRLLAKADAGDTEGTSKVALGSSASHEVKSNEMGAIGIELGAGLTIPLGDEGSSIFMDASAEIRADYTDVNGTVGYRVNF